MKNLFALAVVLFSLNSFASQSTSIDVSKLTAEQRATITQQVNEMGGSPTNISATARKEAEAWGELGANMGKAMVGAAKEVGVAANEFSQTSLGKIVVFMVAYKIVGQDALGVIYGTLVLVFGYSLALWVFITKRWSDITYEYEPILWGAFKKARITKIETSNDVITGKFFAGCGLLILTTVVGLKTIFIS